ncbi:MAG: hypothetical protein HY052_04010 [Proteobacteria bacterium]|nr:hypothetical protein [Pseudomonadota bacterium]
MTDAKKFLFDTHDFSKKKPGADVVYTEEQVTAARNQGVALGLQEAKQRQEERIANLLQKTLDSVEKLAQAEERRELEKCIDTITLAMRVTHKLLPKFSTQYALPEIERVILQALELRKDEPRIAVIVPTVHLETLKAQIDAFALGKGYAGKVILLADDTLPPTDCRVEWADGGAERVYERLFSQMENEFTQAISGVQTNLERNEK